MRKQNQKKRKNKKDQKINFKQKEIPEEYINLIPKETKEIKKKCRLNKIKKLILISIQ
jgi:hypothetical protein